MKLPEPPTARREHVFRARRPRIVAVKFCGMFVVYKSDWWISEHNTWKEAYQAGRKLAG